MGASNHSISKVPFRTTRWSVVAQAQNPDSDEARTGLTQLCQIYWYPLYAFIRKQSPTPQEAEDLTQSFFVHLLENNAVAEADRREGKFRTFLLTCCKNFLTNQRIRDCRMKRGGNNALLPLDFVLANERYQRELVDESTPEAIYERRWAMLLLEQALQMLQQELQQQGKGELYQHLQPILTATPNAARYAQIAKALQTTEGAVRKHMQRMRQRYGQLLRTAIALTLESNELVDEELLALSAILASPQNSKPRFV
jgi:RNA polymerase sigma factor (sigma-70 family)